MLLDSERGMDGKPKREFKIKKQKSKMLHSYYMEENYGWGHRKILLCGNRTLSTLSPELCEKVRRGRREIFTLSPFDCEKKDAP